VWLARTITVSLLIGISSAAIAQSPISEKGASPASPERVIAAARDDRVDVPRVELAARLAVAGFAETPEYRAMHANAARELAGRLDDAGPVSADEIKAADAAIATEVAVLEGKAEPTPSFAQIARQSGRPQIPGLRIVYLHPLGDPARANPWHNILAHQTEGRPGAAAALAAGQAANPTKRGVTLWVETDGTVYWATAEDVIPLHGDGANRSDNKYIDNTSTFHSVVKTNTIGVEFNGNYPDVRTPVTDKEMQTWLILVRFLQERYGIAADHIYAHNWIDYKDSRYCEGCDLARAAREQNYVPTALKN
jgi:hypothetical protein